jgi:hypothetical protein
VRVIVRGDVSYSAGAEPIRRPAVNETIRCGDEHMTTHKYVGLDVHTADTQVAVADSGVPGRAALTGDQHEPATQRATKRTSTGFKRNITRCTSSAPSRTPPGL